MLIDPHSLTKAPRRRSRKLRASARRDFTFNLQSGAEDQESYGRQPGEASLSTYCMGVRIKKAPGVSPEKLHFQPTAGGRGLRKLRASARRSFTFNLLRGGANKKATGVGPEKLHFSTYRGRRELESSGVSPEKHHFLP